MPDTGTRPNNAAVPFWQPVLFAAMAGGLGWGIRGQYGHETGAMIAGVLVSLTLVFLLCPGIATIQVVRAAALGTVAMGIGGTETYGVTLGLCQNPEVVGNWAALRWGLLGCLIKGGLWIGFAGLFLGIGLGGKRYSPLEMLVLGLAMIGAFILGSWLLNSPFDIEARSFSAISFSNIWYWAPDSESTPRLEAWGGLLFAMLVGLAYTSGWKKDALARNMGLWGLLGGAIGFPLGECLQSYHSWNPDVFARGIWTRLDPFMNWWNNMETTFGFTMGAILGLGLWLNRARIDITPDPNEKAMPPQLEWVLLTIHCYLLLQVQVAGGIVEAFYDSGLTLALLPFVCSIRGRIWPWFQVLPVTLLPIALKTIQELVFDHAVIAPGAGYTLYLVLPLFVAILIAAWYATGSAPLKRLLDLLGATIMIVVLAPMLLLVALLIRLESKGGVLIGQERIGQFGRRFQLLKFRTMLTIAQEIEVPLVVLDKPEDPRTTRVGRLLRRYDIDSLPQLLNVLRGDMSVIGPPPLLPSEVELERGLRNPRLECKPGMTYLWHGLSRNRIGFGDWVAMDLAWLGQSPTDEETPERCHGDLNRTGATHERDSYARHTIPFVPLALLVNVWMYFGLNFAFFRFPWPWAEWTARTPNGMVFTVFAIGLTLMVYLNRARPELHPSASN